VIETRAAVLREKGAPLSVETVTIDEPTGRDVLVKVVAASLCHSDLIAVTSRFTQAPMVIGHEASGIVEQVGSSVTGLEVGDRVIFSFVPSCNHCHACGRGFFVDCERGPGFDGLSLEGTTRVHTHDGLDVRQMTRLGVLSERVVVHEDSLLRIPPDSDLRTAALISCGFTTGAGAAINAADTQPGESVVVVGTGGVGTAALQGAVAAGAGRVIAVDVHPAKLALARTFGATDVIDAAAGDWAAEVLALTGGYGADKSLLCVGKGTEEQIGALVRCLRPGGTAVLVGATIGTPTLGVDPGEISSKHKTITGSLYGGTNPRADQLRFLELHRAGRLKLNEMITRTYSLDEVQQALEDLQAGINVRGLIEFAA
jgi:S-(hydroxymethyl)glutathione dehydrogenase/alcohol dehydrogenase